MASFKDTLVARATPPGIGAVAIVRISGDRAGEVGNRLFRSSGGTLLDRSRPRTFLFGAIVDRSGGAIDRGLAVLFRGPASFTGEDVVELHCHGNPLLVDRVIEEAIALGCRPANAGEFTQRAFLNAKMDLVQAEALGELIAAESREAAAVAERQLMGELSARYRELRREIVEVLALLELELDFTEEGYHFVGLERIRGAVEQVETVCNELLRAHESTARMRRGPRVLLAGRPNSGKSSLFNAVLGYSRALVSAHAGTTRDYLEERVSWRGQIIHLLDSAGLREADEELEVEGVRRAMRLMVEVDLVLYLVDSSDVGARSLWGAEVESLSGVTDGVPVLPVWTKRDLATPPAGVLSCSVFDRSSVEALLDELSERLSRSFDAASSLVSDRQAHELRAMRDIARDVLDAGTSEIELVSANLRALLGPLDRLVGATSNDDVLDAVFGSFCIGK